MTQFDSECCYSFLSVTSVPLHVFTAVVLGLYVGRAHFSTSVAALLLPLLAGIAAFGIMAMRKGRCLSLLRWGPGQVPANIPSPHHAHTPGDHRWMSVVANLINDS